MLDPTLEIITNTNIAKGPQTIVQTDGYIILPLRGFDSVAPRPHALDPVAYGRMRWSHSQATKMITKNRRGQPDIRTEIHTDIYYILNPTAVQRTPVWG